jgi:hypothetical protein
MPRIINFPTSAARFVFAPGLRQQFVNTGSDFVNEIIFNWDFYRPRERSTVFISTLVQIFDWTRRTPQMSDHFGNPLKYQPATDLNFKLFVGIATKNCQLVKMG